MRKEIIMAILMLGLGLTAGETPYVPGQLMIQFRPQTEMETAAGVLEDSFQEIGLQREMLLSRRMKIWLFTFRPDAAADEEIIASVKEHFLVQQAQFNHYIQRRETFPDDPHFGSQWNLHNIGQTGGLPDADIDAPEAWDITVGGVTALGDTLVIAVIDGGCDLNHSDLNLFKNIHEIPNNGIDDDNNGYIDDYDGWNAYSHSGNIPTDSHGTHVSGIAGAVGNNGVGVSGVNWQAKIMPIAGESTYESTVVEAYGYVLEMRKLWNETAGALGAFVISTNASFGVDYGNPANYPLWCAIYDSLGAAGVLSAAATMNANVNIDICGDMPTACASDYLITVTNTTNTDNKNNNAAYGLQCIDLGAPGTGIYSTNYFNGYSYKTGTSMASPHLAGAVAMMFSAAPASWLQQYQLDPTKCLEIKQYLLEGVDIIPDLENVTVSGGRLNIANSVDLLLNSSAVNEDVITFSDYGLSNFPNPFNPATEIRFQMSEVGASISAEIVIYNIKGQKVKTLDCCNSFAANARDSRSTYSVIWNGDDDNNKPVSSGVYFCKLVAGKRDLAVNKMLLLR